MIKEFDATRKIDRLNKVGEVDFRVGRFKVFKDEWSDGLKHLYFVNDGSDLPDIKHRRSREIARIGYRVFDGQIMLLGLAVPRMLTGRGMGREMIQYLIEMSKREGMEFWGTGKINKPLIAQLLVRMGFTPISKNIMVEIQPKSSLGSTRVPQVQILENRQDANLITSSDGGDFYRIISQKEAEKLPMVTKDNIVAIQTKYVYPKDKS